MVGHENGNGSSSKDGARRRKTGLIVAGAAAKGPFAAGALKTISRDERFDVRAVAGASSGALNAAVYAAGLRVGKEKEAADLLCDLWKERASFTRIAFARQRRKIVFN